MVSDCSSADLNWPSTPIFIVKTLTLSFTCSAESKETRVRVIAKYNKKGIKPLLLTSCTPQQSSCSCPNRTSCSPSQRCPSCSWCCSTTGRSVIWSGWRWLTCWRRVRWSTSASFGGICRGPRSSCFTSCCTWSCWQLRSVIGVTSFSARLFLTFWWGRLRWALSVAFSARPITLLPCSGPSVLRFGCAANSVNSPGLTFRWGFLWGRTLLFLFASSLRSPTLLILWPSAVFTRWGLSFPTSAASLSSSLPTAISSTRLSAYPRPFSCACCIITNDLITPSLAFLRFFRGPQTIFSDAWVGFPCIRYHHVLRCWSWMCSYCFFGRILNFAWGLWSKIGRSPPFVSFTIRTFPSLFASPLPALSLSSLFLIRSSCWINASTCLWFIGLLRSDGLGFTAGSRFAFERLAWLATAVFRIIIGLSCWKR